LIFPDQVYSGGTLDDKLEATQPAFLVKGVIMIRLGANMFRNILLIFSLLFSIDIFAIEAVIKRLNGEVTVNGRPARIGQKLKERMFVEAQGKKSFVQVDFDNGDIARVRNGAIVIQKLTEKVSTFKVLRGFFFAHAEKKNKRKMNVVTAHSAMGVRGTKFFVRAEETKTYLCVCDGAVELKNNKGEVLVTRGEDIHATKNGDLATVDASKVMWKMATMEFAEMGLKVLPR
jgi:hypothetical protein